MRLKYLILTTTGLICLTVSLVDVLSTKTVKADEGMTSIAIETLVYFLLGLAGFMLITFAIVQHRKERKREKKMRDFYR